MRILLCILNFIFVTALGGEWLMRSRGAACKNEKISQSREMIDAEYQKIKELNLVSASFDVLYQKCKAADPREAYRSIQYALSESSEFQSEQIAALVGMSNELEKIIKERRESNRQSAQRSRKRTSMFLHERKLTIAKKLGWQPEELECYLKQAVCHMESLEGVPQKPIERELLQAYWARLGRMRRRLEFQEIERLYYGGQIQRGEPLTTSIKTTPTEMPPVSDFFPEYCNFLLPFEHFYPH